MEAHKKYYTWLKTYIEIFFYDFLKPANALLGGFETN